MTTMGLGISFSLLFIGMFFSTKVASMTHGLCHIYNAISVSGSLFIAIRELYNIFIVVKYRQLCFRVDHCEYLLSGSGKTKIEWVPYHRLLKFVKPLRVALNRLTCVISNSQSFMLDSLASSVGVIEL